jgi:hypothetical protein
MPIKLKISKLDAAKRQLETAIVLYFHEADPVSIHALASAGYDVLNDLNRRTGGTPMMIKDRFINQIKPEHRKMLLDKINKARNFFKHADKDSDATLDFSPGQSELLLLDACDKYRQLSNEFPPLFKLFQSWYMLKHPDIFTLPKEFEAQKNQLSLRYATSTKQQYFIDFLPYVTGLSIESSQPD